MHSPNSITLNASGLLDKFKNSSVKPKYDRSRLARNPLGGSLVILTARCKMVTGNFGVGIEVSHSRNEGWMSSGLSANSSQIFSSLGSHEMHK